MRKSTTIKLTALFSLGVVSLASAANDSVVVMRDANPPNPPLVLTYPGNNDMPGEVVVTGPDASDIYTITFQTGAANYTGAATTLYEIATTSDGSPANLKLTIVSQASSTKDLGIKIRESASNPAKVTGLVVDLQNNCQSSQIVDSYIAGNIQTIKLQFDAAGPADAGRCAMTADGLVSLTGELNCHNYDLTATRFRLPTLTCTGDFTGFIVATDETADSPVNIDIQGDVVGADIDIPIMSGNITAHNFNASSALRFDEMSGDIIADDGQGGGDFGATLNVTNAELNAPFYGDIIANHDITPTANIIIDLLTGAPTEPNPVIHALNDIRGDFAILQCNGSIIADGVISGGQFLLGQDGPEPMTMAGTLRATNIPNQVTCIYSIMNQTVVNKIVWGDLAKLDNADPGNQPTNQDIVDILPDDNRQDSCADNGCTQPGDADCDGVHDSRDNCPTVVNGPSGGATACIGNQLDDDEDGVGNACDNCSNEYNKTLCDNGDGDLTGDACDVKQTAFDTLFDRDADGDVDGFDFSVFASCFNGVGNPPRVSGCFGDAGTAFDVNCDGDVDGVDFSIFASCFNKAGNSPRRLGCPPAKQSRPSS
jgi:hypothetical protein